MLDNIFDFVLSESCDWGVSYAHNMQLLNFLMLFNFFVIVLKLLPHSLVRRSHKKISHHHHNGNRHSRPLRLQLLLQQPILAITAAPMGAPSQATMLVCLIVARGREVAILPVVLAMALRKLCKYLKIISYQTIKLKN